MSSQVKEAPDAVPLESLFEEETETDAPAVLEGVPDLRTRSAGINWTVASLLVIVGLIFSVVVTTQYRRSASPTGFMDPLTEVDAMEQELTRTQAQSEAIQRELENAPSTAPGEHEALQAVAAPDEDLEPVPSAALATDRAATEAQQAELEKAADEGRVQEED